MTNTCECNNIVKIPTECVLEHYSSSTLRLLLLDYDGTLVPIQEIPSKAIPSEYLLEILKNLTANEKTLVFIISGRDQSFLEKHLGHIPRLGMSAEHGCFIKFPESDSWIEAGKDNSNSSNNIDWKSHVLPIFEHYTKLTPGSFIEDKKTSITWHYRLADPDIGSKHANDCRNTLETTILPNFPIELMSGKKNLEMRPNHTNKGKIVKQLLEKYPYSNFIFCCGDDRTDEDMFEWILNSKTPNRKDIVCLVDNGTLPKRKTIAEYYIDSETKVQSLLESMSHIS